MEQKKLKTTVGADEDRPVKLTDLKISLTQLVISLWVGATDPQKSTKLLTTEYCELGQGLGSSV